MTFKSNNDRNHFVLKTITMFTLGVIFINICLLTIGLSAHAGKHKPGWYMSKKGRVYYYDEKGKKVTKKQAQIGNKYYYFDKKGMQHVGWIKYNGHYYYYNIAPKKKGYRVCNKTINGIKLNSKGWAVNNKDKAKLLAQANTIVFKITNFKMSQTKKNKACFLYIRDKMNWRNISGFRSNNKQWDQFYASYALFKGYGDCYSGGCGFAYLATAAGAKKGYAISSGGHGWARIDGKYYDPNWSWVTKSFDKYFAVTSSESGRGGRPSYTKHTEYVKRIDK